MLTDEVIKDGNVHVLPRIKAGRTTQYRGFTIAWFNGGLQERYMASGFLACRWAKQIAESRGVQAIEHFISE